MRRLARAAWAGKVLLGRLHQQVPVLHPGGEREGRPLAAAGNDPQQQAIWDKYDANFYLFIGFGNKYILTAPLYDPQLLQGKTWAQIAAALHDPSSLIAQGAIGAANYITAAICKMTGNQPASACAAPAIRSLETKL
jgi:hypothetical protein